MIKHSRFSASGATRFMACTASVDIQKDLPEKTSIYAIEGTEAHTYAEELIFTNLLNGKKENQDMIDGAIIYRDHIFSILEKTNDFRLKLECKIELPFIDAELFGTADCIIEDYENKTLHVIDYKYGKTKVDPNCDQLKYYATGAVYQKDFDKIVLTIVQPRMRNKTQPRVRSYETNKEELSLFAFDLSKAVQKIKTGDTTYKTGAYCFFCKAREICPTQMTDKLEKAKSDFEVIQ